jgi:type II secretory pathway predicted ATPase ExeA/HSP20 family molecular chaperone IbpA
MQGIEAIEIRWLPWQLAAGGNAKGGAGKKICLTPRRRGEATAMSLDFYGLREQPFGVTPDPAYLYLSRTHSEALAALLYGIRSDRGFMALIAEPGMGKTTLLYRLIEELCDSARTVFLFQTQCDSREFFCYLLSELGIETAGMDRASMHKKLNDVLFSEMLEGRRTVLVVDEAQNLEGPVLETIRLLSNFETTHSKLLEIVLAGQPQLAENLARPDLSQLRQRIAVLSRLESLSATETACYIEHRLKVAGYSGGPLFSPEALALITEQSQGIPREINSICFSALLLGQARGKQTISGEIAREATEYQAISRGIAQEFPFPASLSVDSIMPQSQAGESPAVMAPPFFELAQEINDLIARRAYELFESSGSTHGHAREDWLRAESQILLDVPVEVTETETELIIRADAPGFGERDLEVRVAPRSLCITGKRRDSSDQQEGKTVYSERSARQIFRVLDLPSQIDPERVSTTVSDGVLDVKLSKVVLGTKVARPR